LCGGFAATHTYYQIKRASAMTTHFITAEIEINENQEAIAKTVEQELAKHGEPLRWAIASVESNVDTQTNVKTQTAHIEAVVTRN
jgi:hypothetical protein